jgi:predicted  nucleic acid-binding Zn-ribbon protein
MSKKSSGQHWYQVHKSKAGDESVARSDSVQRARDKVRAIEVEVQKARSKVHESLSANLRRLVFGRNPLEEQLHQLLIELEEAKRNSSHVENEARKAGQRAYGSGWAVRNPSRARTR